MGIYCNLDPIQLVARGGRSYEWHAITGNSYDPSITALLNHANIADPIFDPDAQGTYVFRVIAAGECYSKDSIDITLQVNESFEANFSIDPDVGCSPHSINITTLCKSFEGTQYRSHEWIYDVITSYSIHYTKLYDLESLP